MVLAPPSCVEWWAVFVCLSPIGVGCRAVGIEGVYFSIYYLVFLAFYVVSIYMVSRVSMGGCRYSFVAAVWCTAFVCVGLFSVFTGIWLGVPCVHCQVLYCSSVV